MVSGVRGLRARLGVLALTALIVLGCAGPASAAFRQSPAGSDPLTIWIGDNGWFQQLVAGNTDNSFFPRAEPQGAGTGTDENANAGFVLAFPTGQSGAFAIPAIEGRVWGWTPNTFNGPAFDSNFTTVDNPAWTGAGTSPDPYTQVTKYDVKPAATPLVRVTQTTTYVNGSSDFVINYAVENLTSDPVKFRAMVGADVYLNGSDCGTGVFKTGPPRFVGGFSNGRVGGFTEAATPWSAYFEGPYGGPFGPCQSDPTIGGVWTYLQNAESGPGLPNTIDPSNVDNGIAIQWDQRFSSALAGGAIETFQVNTLGTVPGTLSLSPGSQSVTAGSPATLTATATDSSGAAAQNILVRFTTSGANSTGGSATTNGSGQATLSYTPSAAGTDTITAFEDLDGNGVRGAGEPQATATVSVSPSSSSTPGTGTPAAPDRRAPRLTVIVQSKAKRKNFMKGLSAAGKTDEPASLKFELLGAPSSKRKARTRARAFTRVLARQSLGVAGVGLRATRLKPKKRLVGKAKKFVVQLRVTAADRAGNKTVVTRRIRVR